jgi:hypothetical protein
LPNFHHWPNERRSSSAKRDDLTPTKFVLLRGTPSCKNSALVRRRNEGKALSAASPASEEAISLLQLYRDKVHTLTLDSGKTFPWHNQIAKTLDADFHLVHPYATGD